MMGLKTEKKDHRSYYLCDLFEQVFFSHFLLPHHAEIKIRKAGNFGNQLKLLFSTTYPSLFFLQYKLILYLECPHRVFD